MTQILNKEGAIIVEGYDPLIVLIKYNLNKLMGAYLRNADLEGAGLRNADLECADLVGADLRGADLRNAGLRNADLEGAGLRGADLMGADLMGANLRNANLRGADLRGACLTGACLTDADLRSADLRNANLRNANLSGANLRNAYLEGADLEGARGLVKLMGVSPGNFYWKRFEQGLNNKGYQFYVGLNKLSDDEIFSDDECKICSYPGFHFASKSWCDLNYSERPLEAKIQIPLDAKINEPWATDGKASSDSIIILQVFDVETGEDVTAQYRR